MYPALFITVEPNSTFLITNMYSGNYYRLRVAHVFTRVHTFRLPDFVLFLSAFYITP